jgi:lysophospholipase L1-like esterase
MKFLIPFFVLISFVSAAIGQSQPKPEPTVFSPDNQVVQGENSSSPVLRLLKSKAELPEGTILLFPDNLQSIGQIRETTDFLNSNNFDVVVIEHQAQKKSLPDALHAFKRLKSNRSEIGLRNNRISIMGILSGGKLAANLVQYLDANEQPNNLILINPSDLNETQTGTVFPLVMPPLHPAARLFCSFETSGNNNWIKSAEEYTKTWKGYDGQAFFHMITDTETQKPGGTFNGQLAGLLKSFLIEKTISDIAENNPAAVPVQGYSPQRHAAKLTLVAKEKYDLIMIGNSITNNFEKPEYQPVWNQFFAPRQAINLGYSGYRTENIIWNIQNGELDGQSPKVIVLEIGTNNIDEKNYPTRHTAGQLAGGITAIVKILREKCPDSKIIVLRCFPGCYGGPNPTSHRAILERASDLVSKIADNKHIFYCDVNHVFLNLDGSINHEMMPDWLHPSPAGAKAWAQAMEPLLSKLMGDQSLDTEIRENAAIVPVSKLENDSYNWWERHAEVLQIKDSINPQIVLIGNSITHFWGGLPSLKYADGKLRTPNGPKAWASAFGSARVLNLGFGWDRTQNVLWRLDHGELDGLHPQKVIIHIGTNNTSETSNARMNTADEIVEGIRAICSRVRSKVPGAEIILMAIMPREQNPDHPRRILINQINQKLEVFAKANHIKRIDIGPKMLAPDGTLPKDIASDFCHPTEKGYQIWADELKKKIDLP